MNDRTPAAVQAFRLYGNVTPDHKLEIELPNTVQEGPAEVIVFTQEHAQKGEQATFESFLHNLKASPRRIKSKEEIDLYLKTEQNSWE